MYTITPGVTIIGIITGDIAHGEVPFTIATGMDGMIRFGVMLVSMALLGDGVGITHIMVATMATIIGDGIPMVMVDITVEIMPTDMAEEGPLIPTEITAILITTIECIAEELEIKRVPTTLQIMVQEVTVIVQDPLDHTPITTLDQEAMLAMKTTHQDQEVILREQTLAGIPQEI